MSTPKLSVVIPTYNRIDLLPQTLKSVIEQSYWGDEIEVMISNDGSKDGTDQYLKEFQDQHADKNIRIFNHKENLGGPGNWKFCGQEAKGEFVYLLSDDDYIAPNFFEEYLKVIKEHPHIDIVFSGIQYCRDHNMSFIDRVQIHSGSQEMSAHEAMKHQLLCHHMVMSSVYRREKLISAGGWDGQFGVHLDCGAFCRTAIRSGRVYYIDQPLFLYRVATSSWSGFRVDKQGKNFRCYRNKIDKLIEDARSFEPSLIPFLEKLYVKHVRSVLNGLEVKVAHGNISKKDLFKVIQELLKVYPEGRGDHVAIKMFVVSFLGVGWLRLLRKFLGKHDPYKGQLAVFEHQI